MTAPTNFLDNAYGLDSSDKTLEHYRQWVLYYLVGAMSLIGSFDTGNERGSALTEAYLTRIAHHIVDIDADEVLD